MPELPYGDWITAVLTICYLHLLTLKKWYAWPLGIVTQVFWIYLTASKGLYGLLALSIVMTFQFIYGWYRWSTDIDPKTQKAYLEDSDRTWRGPGDPGEMGG